MCLEVMAIVIRHYLEIICTPMSEMEGMKYSEKVEQRKEAIDFFESDEFIETGLDLDDLRCIINLEPIGSAVNIDQIIHRLMRGKSTEPTYFIDVVDKSVPHTITMYNRRLKTVKKFVKNIIEIGK